MFVITIKQLCNKFSCKMSSTMRFQRLPLKYWKDDKNKRIFLDKAKTELGIVDWKDWGRCRVQTIKELGGASLLSQYNGSLYKCLKHVYKGNFCFSLNKEVDWKNDWFSTLRDYPNSHWNLISNRKKLFEELQSKLGIQEPRDWGKISIQDIKNAGGASILSYYNNSLFKCLKSTYLGLKFFVYFSIRD